MPPKRVLITGVYGLIGNVIYRKLMATPEAYDVYGLSRRRHRSDRIHQVREVPEENFHLANLSDFDAVKESVAGIDTVVHMAADPSGQRGWESLLNSNIIGAYHIFEASRLAGVKRVIFASSIQVAFGYRRDEPYRTLFEARYDEVDPADIPVITHEHVPRPLNLYASSKVFGEALAHVYADRHGMSCICLRIGWVVDADRPPSPVGRSQWCSQRDIAQLVKDCIDAPDSLRYDVFFGISANRHGWVDIEHPRDVVGYVPQDRAEDHEE